MENPSPLLPSPISSAPMLLCLSLRVLYSYRFFGVGWTVTGAGDFRFLISDFKSQI